MNCCSDPPADALVRVVCGGPEEALFLPRQRRVAIFCQVGVGAADAFFDIGRFLVDFSGRFVAELIVFEELASGVVVVALVGDDAVDGCDVGSRALERDRAGGGEYGDDGHEGHDHSRCDEETNGEFAGGWQGGLRAEG